MTSIDNSWPDGFTPVASTDDGSTSAPAIPRPGKATTAAAQPSDGASAARAAGFPAGFKLWRPDAAPPPAPTGSVGIGDVAKELGAGALRGTGEAVSGIGALGQMIARPIVAGVNAIRPDTLPEPENAFAPVGHAIGAAGDSIANTESDAAKAKNLKARLQQAGLHTDIHNEAPLQQFGFQGGVFLYTQEHPKKFQQIEYPTACTFPLHSEGPLRTPLPVIDGPQKLQ